MISKRTALFWLGVMFGFVVLSAPRQAAWSEPMPRDDGTAVTISNFKFEPKALTVAVGSTVTWTNKGGTHTVTADDDSFNSPNLKSGDTFTHQFTKAGKYPYHCAYHGSKGGGDMSGTITVVAKKKSSAD